MDLLRMNEDALRSLRTVDEAEAYSVRSRTYAVYVDDSSISNIEFKDDAGLSVRVMDGGQMGSAASTMGEDAPRECALRALRAASLSPTDAALRGFSVPQEAIVPAPDVLDRRIADQGPDDLVEMAEAIVSAASPAKVPRGLLRAALVETAVSNSNGVEVSQRSTLVYGHFTSMVVGNSPGEGVQAIHSNHLDMDADIIGSRLLGSARSHAEAISFKGQEELDMILPPSELEDMTLSSIGSALNGENVVLGRSPWSGKEGEKVASECLTVIDDPGSPSLLAGRYDDEGNPTRTKTLVQNGELQGFMFDNYNGASTGNGWRREPNDPQGSYRLPVRIGPANLRITPGRMSLDDIIAETGNGILVERLAWPEVDPLSGRFGLELRCGHLIRDGEKVATIKNALLAGEMFNAWKMVRAVGSENVRGARSDVPPISFAGARLVGV